MPDLSTILVGRKVQQTAEIHDYIQLIFDDGARLNIFNAVEMEGELAGEYLPLPGSTVSSVLESDTAIEIVFSDRKVLRVGMSNRDYSGPEAMEYVGADKQRIVWS